jgi:hypothetical protein
MILVLGKMGCALRCEQLKEKEDAVMNVNISPKEDASLNPLRVNYGCVIARKAYSGSVKQN